MGATSGRSIIAFNVLKRDQGLVRHLRTRVSLDLSLCYHGALVPYQSLILQYRKPGDGSDQVSGLASLELDRHLLIVEIGLR